MDNRVQISNKQSDCSIGLSRKKNISRTHIYLIRIGGDFSFQLKTNSFQQEVQALRSQRLGEYQCNQHYQICSDKVKGVFLSAFNQLGKKPVDYWFSQFEIRFIDENGQEQGGYGDGVRREWFTLLTKEMVNPDFSLFSLTKNGSFFFRSDSHVNPRHLQYFQFIGKLFAFALMHEFLLIAAPFSPLLYQMILKQPINFQDIFAEFQEEASHVRSVVTMITEIKSKEEFEAAGIELPFTYSQRRLLSHRSYSLLQKDKGTERDPTRVKGVELLRAAEVVLMEERLESEEGELLPERVETVQVRDVIDLKPGGANIMVTFETMHQYLELLKNKIFDLIMASAKKPFEAFMAGFTPILLPERVSNFTTNELKIIAQGTATISIQALKEYTNNNEVKQPTIQLFWEALGELSQSDLEVFVWNWTGTDRISAEGVGRMELVLDSSDGPFFFARTCSRSLQVPTCANIEEMRMAVKIVINNIRSGHAVIQD